MIFRQEEMSSNEGTRSCCVIQLLITDSSHREPAKIQAWETELRSKAEGQPARRNQG